MTLSADEYNKWVDERVEMMLKRPGMWGTCRESVELQLVQLMEFRKLVNDSDAVAKNPRLIVDEWIEFGKKYKCGNKPLFSLKNTDDEYYLLLRELAEYLKNA
jgi:hypothetical protein